MRRTVRHAHHLVRHPIGFALEGITRLADREFRLHAAVEQHALERLVAHRVRARPAGHRSRRACRSLRCARGSTLQQ